MCQIDPNGTVPLSPNATLLASFCWVWGLKMTCGWTRQQACYIPWKSKILMAPKFPWKQKPSPGVTTPLLAARLVRSEAKPSTIDSATATPWRLTEEAMASHGRHWIRADDFTNHKPMGACFDSAGMAPVSQDLWGWGSKSNDCKNQLISSCNYVMLYTWQRLLCIHTYVYIHVYHSWFISSLIPYINPCKASCDLASPPFRSYPHCTPWIQYQE